MKGDDTMQFKLMIAAVVISIIGTLYGMWQLAKSRNDALRNEIQALSVQVETQQEAIRTFKNDLSLIQEEYGAYLIASEQHNKQTREAVEQLTEQLDETLSQTDTQALGDDLSGILNGIFSAIGTDD